MINKILGEPYVDELIRLVFSGDVLTCELLVQINSESGLDADLAALTQALQSNHLIGFTRDVPQDRLILLPLKEVIDYYNQFSREIEKLMLDNLSWRDKTLDPDQVDFDFDHWIEWKGLPSSVRYERLGLPQNGDLSVLLPMWRGDV